MKRREFNHRLASASLLAVGTSGAAQRAQAQADDAKGPGGFPDRLIKLVVPYPAGGVVDVVMRAISEPVSNLMPNRILVENRTGADGRIGLDAVAKSPADGYTLLSATPLIATGEHMMADMKGKAQEFVGVYGVAAPPAVFCVSPSLPVKTLKEFVALAASKPGEINVANPGSGSSNHLGQELLFDVTGIRVTNIAYKGQPPSLADIAQGHTHFGLLAQNLALPLIRSGKLRPLASNTSRRTRSLPEVPTVAEAGFAEVLVLPWYGIAAPARTPPAVVQYLSERIAKALAMPETRAKYEAMDAEILDLPAARFQALIDSEFKRWGALIKKRGILAS